MGAQPPTITYLHSPSRSLRPHGSLVCLYGIRCACCCIISNVAFDVHCLIPPNPLGILAVPSYLVIKYCLFVLTIKAWDRFRFFKFPFRKKDIYDSSVQMLNNPLDRQNRVQSKGNGLVNSNSHVCSLLGQITSI